MEKPSSEGCSFPKIYEINNFKEQQVFLSDHNHIDLFRNFQTLIVDLRNTAMPFYLLIFELVLAVKFKLFQVALNQQQIIIF